MVILVGVGIAYGYDDTEPAIHPPWVGRFSHRYRTLRSQSVSPAHLFSFLRESIKESNLPLFPLL